MHSFFISTHPGTGVPIVLAGSKLTSDQVVKSFGKTPKPRKIEMENTQAPLEEPDAESTFPVWFWLRAAFWVMFMFFYFFPQSNGQTPASFINNLLPEVFRVHNSNVI